ncbi:TonB-dependent receptor plug domain-containing protein [Sphingobium sp.]|uniref:TonB-dependent receptor plug domain-containing protein n=1 Tax=Sphingobium sp. TaxID=1912891 RepID=UPI003B3A30D3
MRPLPYRSITAEELKQRSYTDITDALINVPGVHIQDGGVEQSIMMRGMSTDYTLFPIDGRRMQDNQAFGLNGQQTGTPVNFLPPLDSIERIGVVRGPASSLHGSDAIGGVIPEHMVNASLNWDATDMLKVCGQANYRGKTSGRTNNSSGSGTNDFRYLPYTFYNLALVLKPKKDLAPNVGVYNPTSR